MIKRHDRSKPLRTTVTGSLNEVNAKINDHLKRGNKLIQRGELPRKHGNAYNYQTGHNNTRAELGTDSISRYYAVIEMRCNK